MLSLSIPGLEDTLSSLEHKEVSGQWTAAHVGTSCSRWRHFGAGQQPQEMVPLKAPTAV